MKLHVIVHILKTLWVDHVLLFGEDDRRPSSNNNFMFLVKMMKCDSTLSVSVTRFCRSVLQFQCEPASFQQRRHRSSSEPSSEERSLRQKLLPV